MTLGKLIRKSKAYPPDTEVWMQVDAGIDLVGGLERAPGMDRVVIYPDGGRCPFCGRNVRVIWRARLEEMNDGE